MSGKTATLDTLQFALELLKRIPRSHKVSAPELSRQLNEAGWKRDLRTVQRQLDELAQHFDIERDARSKPYGYRWKEQAKGLSLPGLSEKESLVLALAEQHLRALLPAPVLSSMQPFFEQARLNLRYQASGGKTGAAREWMDKVRVVSTTQPLLPPKIRPGVLEAVSSALYANHWLEIEYVNSSNRKSSGSVMPLGLAQQGPRLYLVCRFKDFDDERILAVHRIASAAVSNLEFERPPEFDLARYDNDGQFGFTNGKRIRLKLRIEKAAGLHLLESPLAKDQAVTEDGEHYRITATVVDTAQLVWWLRGFGSAVEVLSPKRVAARL
jgi:predicted DNA-binding transcriptional regulator YafY